MRQSIKTRTFTTENTEGHGEEEIQRGGDESQRGGPLRAAETGWSVLQDSQDKDIHH